MSGRTVKYACDYCGYEGKASADEPLERVQCPMCGEPVIPLD